MDPHLSEQRRYFEIRLEQCRQTPAHCPEQIRVYESYLQMVDSCSSAAEFLEKVKGTGQMYDVAQAEATDQREGLRQIAEQTGQVRKTKAHSLVIDAIAASGSHADMHTRVTESNDAAMEIINAENAAIMQLGSLFQGLLEYICESNEVGGKDDLRKNKVQVYWNQMKEHDPELTWERILTYPPYRGRLPYSDAHLAILKNYMEEALNGQ